MNIKPVEFNDPRFLYNISCESLTLETSNIKDINWRIEKARELIKDKKHNISDSHIEDFQTKNIALSEYDWIDKSDTVIYYFIWHIALQLKSSNIKNFEKLSFDFNEVFFKTIDSKISISIPIFNITSKSIHNDSIVLLHAFMKHFSLEVNNQKIFINLVKNRFYDFKKSNFFQYTLDENKDRAEWTLANLEKDGVTLPREIPTNEKVRRYALAIAFFFWDRKSNYSPNSLLLTDDDMSKSEFLFKLNSRWNQYSHRKINKKNNIKAYSFEMSEDITKKLRKLSDHHGIKKNKLVQSLIEQAYDKIINK